MREDDVCRCPNEHRLVLLGTCWRCLGKAPEREQRIPQPVG